MYVSGLGKVDNRICMVLEWTLGLPTPGSIFSAAVSVYISREHVVQFLMVNFMLNCDRADKSVKLHTYIL